MADEFTLGEVGPIPTVNPNVAKIGEMLKIEPFFQNLW